MNTGVISTRYAAALLEYAREQGAEDAVYENMRQLIATLGSVKDFMPVLCNPTLASEERVGLICSAVAPSAVFHRFAQLVVKEEREDMLLFIAHAYLSLYRKAKNIRAVKLTAAVPVDEELEEGVRRMLAGENNAGVEIESIVDESLIGGFIMEVDSLRLDASVQGQLREIRKQLVKPNRKLV